MKAVLIIMLSLYCMLPLHAQTSRFRLMEYNVENLFDCEDDSLKNDDEFLPDALRKWNYGKYRAKLERLMKVIVAVGEDQVPDLVALCEVENENVLRDLTLYTPLKVLGYRFVMTDSSDERGIDVALLYQPGRFRLLSQRNIHVSLPGERPTRDIMHISGKIMTGDTLDVFVVHFPSRAGGEKTTRPYRIHVAKELKCQYDSVFAARKNPQIVVTGDFNDFPESMSISEILGASYPSGTVFPHKLYNVVAGCKPGTYRYQGVWGIFDHILVSGTLLDTKNKFHTSAQHAEIVTFPFLLEKDTKYGGLKPFRTYLGPRYKGGYSDHLPVRVDFFFTD